jgi:hypothetical protein
MSRHFGIIVAVGAGLMTAGVFGELLSRVVEFLPGTFALIESYAVVSSM